MFMTFNMTVLVGLAFNINGRLLYATATHCNTLQHTATYCNTLQRTATHCNI